MNRLQSNLQSVLFNEKIKNLTARRNRVDQHLLDVQSMSSRLSAR